MAEKVKTFEDLETNILYIMTYAMDLLLQDLDRKFHREGGYFHQHKKLLFRRYSENIRQAVELSKQLTAHVEAATAAGRYKELDKFAMDGNEMVRLLLAYCDKSDDPGNVEAVFKFLGELPGGSVVTVDKLNRFYLR